MRNAIWPDPESYDPIGNWQSYGRKENGTEVLDQS